MPLATKIVGSKAFAIIPVLFSVTDFLAVILTLFRLFLRLRIRRFWWEDAWAAVTVVFGTIFSIAQIIYSEPGNSNTAYITTWIIRVTFTSTVWAVRMSLLYSIIRIISPASHLRKITRGITFMFLVFWAIPTALKIWWCIMNSKPIPSEENLRSVCIMPQLIILFEMITDCVSDAILVLLSLKLLWRVKLPRRQRRMILCSFSSSAVISICSLFHAICQLIAAVTIEYIAFELELTAALIVCDLVVIVTYAYRVLMSTPNGSLPSESESSAEDDDFTTRPPRSLTTVDLNTVILTTRATRTTLSVGSS